MCMEVDIFTGEDSIYVEKENQTKVNYYLFDEYEIHKCVIPANSFQEWHRHKLIDEILYVTAGEIIAKWMEDGKEQKQTLTKDMMINVKHSMHTIANESNAQAEFVVFRVLPTGMKKQGIIKQDKYYE